MRKLKFLFILSISLVMCSGRVYSQEFYIPHGLHLLPLLYPDGDPSDEPITGAAKEANYARLIQRPVEKIREIAQREFLDSASEDSPELASIAKATIADTKSMNKIKAKLQPEGFDFNNFADVATVLVLSSYNLSKTNSTGNGSLTEKEVAAARKSMTEVFVSSLSPDISSGELRFQMEKMLLERLFQDKIIESFPKIKDNNSITANDVSEFLIERSDQETGFNANNIRINGVQGIVER